MSLSSLTRSLFKAHESAPRVIVDQDAVILLNSAARAVKAILDRRTALDATEQKGKPLVVLLGEVHHIVSHYMQQMLVLNGLRKAGIDPAIMHEMPHNTVSQCFLSSVALNDDANAERFRALDNDGSLGSKVVNALWLQLLADHSMQTLHYFLTKNKFFSKFNDAARNGLSLDSSDPSTLQSLKACNAPTDKDVLSKSTGGVYVRNHHMAKVIEDFSAVEKYGIIIQRCGFGHVAGIKNILEPQGDLDFRYSLASLLKKKGIPILALPYLVPDIGFERIPHNHDLETREYHYVKGLPQTAALYDPINDKPLELPKGAVAHLQNRAAEIAHLNSLMKRIGLEDYCIEVEDLGSVHAQAQEDLRHKFSEWLTVLDPDKPKAPAP